MFLLNFSGLAYTLTPFLLERVDIAAEISALAHVFRSFGFGTDMYGRHDDDNDEDTWSTSQERRSGWDSTTFRKISAWIGVGIGYIFRVWATVKGKARNVWTWVTTMDGVTA